MFKKIIFLFSMLALVVGSLGLARPVAASTVSLSSLQAGDLVRGQSLPAVYYFGKDGFRYVFPNDKTYFTWYENFDSVKWLSDADLGKLQIGGNVTYKPGTKMIKINSDPKTYAVGQNGELHWVTSEAVAVALYGTNWNTKIDDVPDGFFSNYSVDSDIEAADDFIPAEQTAAAQDINDDKDLNYPTYISTTDSGYSKSSVTISAGRVIKFTNNGTSKHTATAEDLSWGSGTLNAGDSFSRYFNEPGTHEVFCSYHSSETMTIIVE
ncbi:MAG: hypothetical protein V1664_04605 [Candidatus Uhrbacteria bacterium]